MDNKHADALRKAITIQNLILMSIHNVQPIKKKDGSVHFRCKSVVPIAHWDSFVAGTELTGDDLLKV